MNEIQVPIVRNALTQIIEVDDFDKTLETLKTYLKKYDDVSFVATLDNLTEIKEERAIINNTIKKLDTARIAKDKEIEESLLYQKQIKEMTTMLKDTELKLASSINRVLDEQKEKKRLSIENIFDMCDKPFDFTLDKIFDEKWLNAGFTLNAVQEAIIAKIEEVDKNLELFEKLYKDVDRKNMVLKLYRESLDFQKSVDEENRYYELSSENKVFANKEIEESEKQKAQNETIYRTSFVVYATKSQLLNLSSYLRENKIRYEQRKGE